VFGFADFVYLRSSGALPQLKEIWVLALLVPLLCGTVVTLGAGGATLTKRVLGAAVCGIVLGVLYAVVSAALGYGDPAGIADVVTSGVWRAFVFSVFSSIGAILTELKLPEPNAR
jgi:hypothetical protein